MPFDFVDHILVTLERVDLAMAWESEIEDANRSVRGASREQYVLLWVERERVDGIAVSLDANCGLGIGFAPQIYQAESLVVRNTAKKVFAVMRVKLDVVDY